METTLTIQKLPSWVAEVHPQSTVWIFAANKALNETQKIDINNTLQNFASNWNAHGTTLAAVFSILYDQFIVICTDHNIAAASGCSIDKLVHTMQEIESKHAVDLLNKLRYFVLCNNKILSCPWSERALLQKKIHTEDAGAVQFQMHINTAHQLQNEWILPIDY